MEESQKPTEEAQTEPPPDIQDDPFAVIHKEWITPDMIEEEKQRRINRDLMVKEWEATEKGKMGLRMFWSEELTQFAWFIMELKLLYGILGRFRSKHPEDKTSHCELIQRGCTKVHPTHPLILTPIERKHTRRCDLCQETLYRTSYQCLPCDFDACLECLLKASQTENNIPEEKVLESSPK